MRAKILPSVIKLYWPAGPGLTKPGIAGWVPAGDRICGTGGEICIPGRRFVWESQFRAVDLWARRPRAFLFATSNDDELNSCRFGFLGTSNDDLNACICCLLGRPIIS